MSLDFYASVTQFKNNLLVSGYKNGRRVLEKVPYKPYLFVTARDGKYKTVFDQPVDRVDFGSIWEAREFTKKYEGVEGFSIYGMSTWPYVHIYDEFTTNKKKYVREHLSVVELDIETDTADGYSTPEAATAEITAITLGRDNKYVTLGVKDFDTSEWDDVTYIKCRDEKHLLEVFLKIWNSEQFSPDIITGWNIDTYDVPYIINRITRILGMEAMKKLSPFKMVESRTVQSAYGEQVLWSITGVAIYDYLQLYIKFIVPNKGQPESKSLNYICQEELGEEKLDYSEYGDLDTLYKKNPQKYYEYNMRDVRLVYRLEQKLRLINLAILMTYDAGVNFTDVFGTIRVWDASIHEYLRDRNIVVPYAREGDLDFSIEGGYVKDPVSGQYNWVASFDLASSYPHQCIMYNIGAETFVDMWPHARADDFVARRVDIAAATENGRYCIAGNGARFRRDRVSFMSALMQLNFDKRKAFKDEMLKYEHLANQATDPEEKKKYKDLEAAYDNMQHGTKIKINAFYGACANKYFRWNDPRIAEAITQSGQLAIKWAEQAINKHLNTLLKSDKDFVIAIDTDSLYVTLNDLILTLDPNANNRPVKEVIAMMDKLVQRGLQDVLQRSFDDLAAYIGAYSQKMQMKREVLANRGIWTGKKHYILNVYDKEGVPYDPPKKKIVGIEAVRSSTPNAARKKIKEGIDIILSGTEDDLHSFVEQVKKDFYTLPIDEIASPRSAKDIEKWVDSTGVIIKGTPIQARAAINHNILIDRLEIKRFRKIASGEKIKFVKLKKFNPYGFPVVGFSDILPPEFDLEEYVDRYMQFEGGFLSPLKNITDAIGWTTEPMVTLDAFFV